jgi:uncharacterized protein YfaS (alpha-2-macroglobulin family)
VNTERNKNPLEKKLPGFIFGDADEDTVRSRVKNELEETACSMPKARPASSVDLSPVGRSAARPSPCAPRSACSKAVAARWCAALSASYWPAPVLVGLRPMFVGAYAREGSERRVRGRRADMQRATLKAGTALPVRIFRENRNWYWRFDDQRGWHSGYNETDELVATTQVSVPPAAAASCWCR